MEYLVLQCDLVLTLTSHNQFADHLSPSLLQSSTFFSIPDTLPLPHSQLMYPLNKQKDKREYQNFFF